MNKKVAIPIENGILSGHFGHAKHFSLVHVTNGEIVKEETLVPPPHEPGVLPRWLSDIGTTDILAGGLGQQAIQILLRHNINVYVGVAQKEPKALVEDFLNDNLSAGANYCTH